ncbi:MAG: cupredoxin domain-containing protein, partial [Candidatus Halalkalibacterium sp. M3_1C_030]
SVTGDPSLSTIEGSAELPKDAKPFNSGMMDPEQTFEHTFEIPGTYKYFCIPHEGTRMYGWVIVD